MKEKTEAKTLAEINNLRKKAMDTKKPIIIGVYYGLTHTIHPDGTETFRREN